MCNLHVHQPSPTMLGQRGKDHSQINVRFRRNSKLQAPNLKQIPISKWRMFQMHHRQARGFSASEFANWFWSFEFISLEYV